MSSIQIDSTSTKTLAHGKLIIHEKCRFCDTIQTDKKKCIRNKSNGFVICWSCAFSINCMDLGSLFRMSRTS